jgi:hypothetical protein
MDAAQVSDVVAALDHILERLRNPAPDANRRDEP